MANRFKESGGYCDHCAKRVLVRRKDAFFHGWRCTVCGSPVRTVGDYAVRQREANTAAQQVAAASEASREAWRVSHGVTVAGTGAGINSARYVFVWMAVIFGGTGLLILAAVLSSH